MKLLIENWRKFLKEEEILAEKCWDGYKQAGMKKKGDRMVPNCVPVGGAKNEANNLSEQQQPVIHFMDWLIDKTNRVHSKPGQGSIFAIPTEQVVEKVKEVAGSVTNVSEIANGSGALSVKVPGIGYDLVAKVVNGKPVDQKGMPIEGQMTTINKEEGRDAVQVEAIETNRPLSDFETDDLTIIIRPMKTKDGEIIPNEYIILSAFPGTTGADLRASEWGGKYVVVLPK